MTEQKKSPKVIHLETAPGYSEDDDSDAAMWAALKHRRKSRNVLRMIDFEGTGRKRLEELLSSPLVKHSVTHYSFEFKGTRVDYWPSSGRWRYNGHSYFGDSHSILGHFAKRIK